MLKNIIIIVCLILCFTKCFFPNMTKLTCIIPNEDNTFTTANGFLNKVNQKITIVADNNYKGPANKFYPFTGIKRPFFDDLIYNGVVCVTHLYYKPEIYLYFGGTTHSSKTPDSFKYVVSDALCVPGVLWLVTNNYMNNQTYSHWFDEYVKYCLL